MDSCSPPAPKRRVKKGFSLLTVDASPMSLPFLEKYGFRNLANSTPCNWRIVEG